MKKFLFFSVFILSGTLYSQIYTNTGGASQIQPAANPSTNNVGIGANNPNSKLSVNGNATVGLNYSSTQAPDNGLIVQGKAGFGVVRPEGALDIRGGEVNNVTYSSIEERNGKNMIINAGQLIGGSTTNRQFRFYDFPQSNFDALANLYLSIEDRDDYARFRFQAFTGGGTNFLLFNKLQEHIFKVSENNDFVICSLAKPDSYMTIGTTSYTDGSEMYKLSVKGKVRAEEVKVYNTWADYVFNSDYNLKSLVEVESFINENGHLPNVPSACEIEEKGLMLGDMTKIQQEKIEELTLYLIQQNKEIEELKTQVKLLLEKK